MLLNTEKCEVFFINATPLMEEEMFYKINALLPGIKRPDESSFDLFGAPIFEGGLSEC